MDHEEYVVCHLCQQLVRYEDDITVDASGLEHECDGSEDVAESDWLEDEDVSDAEKADVEIFTRDHDI